MHAESNTGPKLCECGCGKPAPIAVETDARHGWVRGEAKRFINGHNSHRHTAETKAKIGEAGRGRKPSAETRAKIAATHRGMGHTAETRAKMSASMRTANKLRPPRNGLKAPGWKNGRTTHRGRVIIFVGRDHPMANSHGYVYEHRLVLAVALGRYLEFAEHVHHIDLDAKNNAPENLLLVTGSQHMSIHRFIQYGAKPLEAVAMVLGREAL